MLLWILIAAGIGILLTTTLLLYCCCRIAGLSDRAIEAAGRPSQPRAAARAPLAPQIGALEPASHAR